MINFPDSLPMDSILLVISKIKGKEEHSNKEFAQALWNIVGYAANQTIPEDRPLIGEIQDLNLEDFAAILEQAITVKDSPEVTKLPWANILKIGLKLLISIFL
jgi:hypothetical protein